MKTILLASAAAVALLPSAALAQTTDGSPIDTILPATDGTVQAQPATRTTGDAVLDRLNALDARIKQLEARNAELEQQAAETQNRVQNVEVRAAKAAQPGVVPTYADVNDNFTFKPRGVLQVDYATFNERAGGYQFNDGTDIRRARFGFEGTAYKRFKWRLDAEYVKQSVNILDAYVSYVINPKLSITVGQHKAPYGLEANTSDVNNTFMERSLGSTVFGAVGAERRIGLSFAYNTDKLNATVGVFGSGEAITRNNDTAAAVTVSSTTNLPTVTNARAGTRNESAGVNGRITFDPILDTGRVVHLGASAYHVTNFAGNAVTLADRPNSRVDGGNLISVALRGAAATPTTPSAPRCSPPRSMRLFGLMLAWSLVRYLPRQEAGGCAGRPALRAADCGGRHRADRAVCEERLARPVARRVFGIKVAFGPLGVLVALIFIGLPFVVRTVQPILEDLDTELEEAATSLGARRWQTFRFVTLPILLPALLTGFALAFARAVGEYGSVIFIAGNIPMVSEITPLMIITKLEQYDYAGATAIAVVMLVFSFLLL
jgi:hypothetical protein